MKNLEKLLLDMGFTKVGPGEDDDDGFGFTKDERDAAIANFAKTGDGIENVLAAIFGAQKDSEPGRKDDSGKPLASIIYKDFPTAMSMVIDVATFGANKYARGNWKKVEDAEQRYEDAFHRHLLDEVLGEETDEESEVPHLGHALWNLMALIELRYGKQ